MDDAARRAEEEVHAAWVQWRSQDDDRLSVHVFMDLVKHRFATALRELEEKLDDARRELTGYYGIDDALRSVKQERDALATRLARAEWALRAVMERVYHCPLCKSSVLLSHADKCPIGAALTPDATTEGTHE